MKQQNTTTHVNEWDKLDINDPDFDPTRKDTPVKDGMKVYHNILKLELTVVADEKGPAYTGNEFKDNEISLSHAITEYNNGNLTPVKEEGYTKGEWVRYIQPDEDGLVTTINCEKPSKRIATLSFVGIEETEANAQLIISAPKLKAENDRLIKILDAVLTDWHSKDGNFHKKEPAYLKSIREAIQKHYK